MNKMLFVIRLISVNFAFATEPDDYRNHVRETILI